MLGSAPPPLCLGGVMGVSLGGKDGKEARRERRPE